MEVAFHEYFGKLLDQAAFNISCMASVKDTNFDYFAQDDFRVRKPDIKITIQGEPVADREVDVIVRLTNPLPIPLRKGTFQLEGPGLEKQLTFKVNCFVTKYKLVPEANIIPFYLTRYLKFLYWEQHQLPLNTHHILLDAEHLPLSSSRRSWMMLTDFWPLK